MIQRIALLGVGLIGGSLALSWQQRREGLTIVGYDRPDVLEEASRRGVIDAMAADPIRATAEADLVVLATPIAATLHLLETIAPHLRPGTMVTDVGSVKGPVMGHARDVLPEGLLFMGGHPMAGAEHSGVAYADAFLFENATYVVCPPIGMEQAIFMDTFAEALTLIELTGARILVLDADRHDRIAAAVSHLPQLLAVALTNHAHEQHTQDDAFLRLAAGGFRDLTRIATSPFGMWRDILVANQGAILDAMAAFTATFQRLRNRLIEEDLQDLQGAFQSARTVRQSIPKDSKGFLHPLSDVYVYTKDEPGALFNIIRVLYDASIDIKDIELLKLREGTGGTFRLGFRSDADARSAVAVFHAHAYTAYQL